MKSVLLKEYKYAFSIAMAFILACKLLLGESEQLAIYDFLINHPAKAYFQLALCSAPAIFFLIQKEEK